MIYIVIRACASTRNTTFLARFKEFKKKKILCETSIKKKTKPKKTSIQTRIRFSALSMTMTLSSRGYPASFLPFHIGSSFLPFWFHFN